MQRTRQHTYLGCSRLLEASIITAHNSLKSHLFGHLLRCHRCHTGHPEIIIKSIKVFFPPSSHNQSHTIPSHTQWVSFPAPASNNTESISLSFWELKIHNKASSTSSS
ncbi:hypothetical protein GDO81_004033 [Engystomops pustulosus]|uniref:Uncharacterized protein n=1 Tax=Engystomops pustulosus TaxID=76066 RepID=A0AAV6ZPH8_ENGPU|nr:hypothetical protein GDO81_004033 [Engystomops pustulosus]